MKTMKKNPMMNLTRTSMRKTLKTTLILLQKQTGLTIFLVEQNAKLALNISQRGYVIETGQIILSGEKEELMNNKEVIRAYLGKE